MSDDLSISILLLAGLPLVLKLLQIYVPWLTIEDSGSHTKRASESES